MKLTSASLADPFDRTPVQFPEFTEHLEKESGPHPSHPPNFGDWHYSAKRGTRALTVAALAASAAAHALVFFGFEKKPPPKREFQEEAFSVTLMKMPEIPEEPDDSVPDVNNQSDLPDGVDVPRLPDVLSSVALENTLTQQFDARSLQPNVNFSGTKLMSIPTQIRPGGAGGHGSLKDIFNLADLDRAPAAIIQPMPALPASLRQGETMVELTIEFVIDRKGDVIDVKVIKSTNSDYNDVASSAVLKWRFKPGMKKGRPVATRIIQPMIIKVNAQNS